MGPKPLPALEIRRITEVAETQAEKPRTRATRVRVALVRHPARVAQLIACKSLKQKGSRPRVRKRARQPWVSENKPSARRLQAHYVRIKPGVWRGRERENGSHPLANRCRFWNISNHTLLLRQRRTAGEAGMVHALETLKRS
jgi:hypothetical protein